MTDPAITNTPVPHHELLLERVINATPDKLYRAWTEPELLKQWFCPKPFWVSHAEMDVRAGGASLIVMNGPNGEVMPNPGIYLEVAPNRRLVFTDAYTTAWEPSGKPFMTGIIQFEPVGTGQTRYTARVRHWSAEDRQAHVDMGFYEGWGKATDQLEELVGRM